ncbi:hypothetical protein GFM01_34855 [Rhizobium laguerreae]|nr:hypothetical protein [Rhizobium laguerreae]NKM32136.1 hypothetical protein [Rhizobium laguerreae]
MRKSSLWRRVPEPGKAKTWLVYGRSERGDPVAPPLSIATLVTCPIRRSQIVSRVRDAANVLRDDRVVGQMP